MQCVVQSRICLCLRNRSRAQEVCSLGMSAILPLVGFTRIVRTPPCAAAQAWALIHLGPIPGDIVGARSARPSTRRTELRIGLPAPASVWIAVGA